MKIVVFIGKKGSGKTTAADFLIQNHGFERVAFADKLKYFCSEIFNIPVEYFYDPSLKEVPIQRIGSGPFAERHITPRLILQWFGTEGCRYLWKDVWVHWLKRKIEKEDQVAKIVIDDCRFPNEQEMLKGYNSCFIRVIRPGYNGDQHASETEQDKLVADYVVFNKSELNFLFNQISEIISK